MAVATAALRGVLKNGTGSEPGAIDLAEHRDREAPVSFSEHAVRPIASLASYGLSNAGSIRGSLRGEISRCSLGRGEIPDDQHAGTNTAARLACRARRTHGRFRRLVDASAVFLDRGRAQRDPHGRRPVRRFAHGPPSLSTDLRPSDSSIASSPGGSTGMRAGQIRYALVTNDAGGILDDVLVYHLVDPRGHGYHQLVVNASNRDKIIQWITSHDPGVDAEWHDVTHDTAMIAVQGPGLSISCVQCRARSREATYYYGAEAQLRGVAASSVARAIPAKTAAN